ncbi:hypothetical protein T01_6690 [Trichinella spiralis]|uniref:Uncharacterized protein n=1 Tax=Trichinella spiralis TaxID=6334 RepID=A0A0V1B2P9_TRISP|nr:hypothetical protein T01_5357 [Trichinella spiralis]KRY31201.1 hypothetical protein T01_6690 [Trichinella spiralis]
MKAPTTRELTTYSQVLRCNSRLPAVDDKNNKHAKYATDKFASAAQHEKTQLINNSKEHTRYMLHKL